MKTFLVITVCILTKITAYSQFADTSLWAPNGPVNALLLKDSLLYVGGSFDQVSPVTGNFVAVDSASAVIAAPFPSISGKINCMVKDEATGNIYVGGLFSMVGITDCMNLFRLTPQGNFDSTFLPNPDGEIFELVIGWNNLYIGGSFGNIEGSSRGRGAAIFLGNDSLTPFDPAADGPIYAFAPDTITHRLIVGGNFFYLGIGTIQYLGKVNSDNGNYIPYGNSWWATQPQVMGPVKDIVMLHGDIYVVGDFNNFGSVSSPGIGVVTMSNGVLKQQFDAGLDGFVHDIEVINDTVYLAGDFTSSHSATRNHLACFDDSLHLLPWNPSVDGPVNCIAHSADRSFVYVAGAFHTINGDTVYNAAKIQRDSLGTVIAWNPEFNGPASAIIPAAITGRVWVGGDFSGAGGVLRKNLCAINVNSKIATSWNPVVNGSVTTLCADNTQLFVSGNFSTINGQPKNRLASFDLSGLSLTAFNPGVNGLVRTMVSDNANLFLGGNFSNVAGQNRSNIASVHISTSAATLWNPGCAGTVNKLLLDGDHVYVGGYFTQCGGQLRDNMAKIDKSTGLAAWSWSCNTDGGVYDMDLYNGQLYMGGWFQHAGGQPRSYLAAADTISGSILSYNPSAENFIRCFARWDDDLFISGPFVSIGPNLAYPRLCNYDIGDGQFDAWAPMPDDFPVTMQASQTQFFMGGYFSRIGYKFVPNLALINIAWVTDVPENAAASVLKTWPVPSADLVHINITGMDNTVTLHVIDINGKVVRSETAAPGIITMDIHELAPGMYTVQVTDESGRESSARIIRQ